MISKKSIFATTSTLLFLLIVGPGTAFMISPEAYAQDSALLEDMEKRLSELEKKTSDMESRQDHADKHILHMEKTIPRTIDGLSIAGGITMILQGTAGNNENDSGGGDVIDGNISADLEAEVSQGERGLLFILIETGAGDGLQDDEIESFWGVNDDAGDNGSTLVMTEAWYEHRFFDDMLVFTAGKLDLTNYFDGNEAANDETEQFLATGFVNNSAVEFPGNSLASRLTWSPGDFIDISIAWQDGDGDYEGLFEDGFYMAEVGIKPVLGGHGGNYRIYSWVNNTRHVAIGDPDDDEPGWGIGTSMDQQVVDAITVFVRVGYQDPEVYAFNMAWSAGISLRGEFWGREDDVFGAAYGMAMLSDDYKDTLEATGVDTANEGHFEAYYRIALNDHVAISPDVQVVTNALGDNDFDTVVIAGLRGQFTF